MDHNCRSYITKSNGPKFTDPSKTSLNSRRRWPLHIIMCTVYGYKRKTAEELDRDRQERLERRGLAIPWERVEELAWTESSGEDALPNVQKCTRWTIRSIIISGMSPPRRSVAVSPSV